MKFTIVERKIKIEDELRQYALRKVEKLDRYFQQDSDTTITFSELRGKQTVEITVRQVGLVVRAEDALFCYYLICYGLNLIKNIYRGIILYT